MADVRVRAENGFSARTIQDFDQQITFLDGYGIGLERWDVSKHDADSAQAAADPQAYILEAFKEELDALKTARGYRSADVIALSPETPNLDGILAKFDKEHYHAEDEVRFVVHGRGIFTIHGPDDDCIFDVEVSRGDLLVVPEGALHWFTLCEDRTIQCIRVFSSGGEGWVPHYT